MAHVDFGIRSKCVVCACLVAATAVSFSGWQQSDLDLAKAIEARLMKLRSLPDDVRARDTRQLALDIRGIGDPKLRLQDASGLANLATEGDFGNGTLQEVATTLERAVRAMPHDSDDQMLPFAIQELATLARYEHVKVTLKSPEYRTALAKIEATERIRANADFSLLDIEGKPWKLSSLRGKVVLVNFWATWCPPCRKEMPDLDALYAQFKDQGLVVLAISDETTDKVKPFIAEHRYRFPILLDPGRTVNTLYQVDGIPKSFVYDRQGKLVAQAIDMRTQSQLLEMLAKAGLK